jgi:CRP-like cAMP-binding protein
MRTAAPVLPGSSHTLESPIDRAFSLLFAQEREAALRWAAAIVKQDPLMATGLLVCGRLLGDMGRQEVGREACAVAVARAIDLENLPLAVAAAREIERLGGDAGRWLDEIAAAFCRGSARRGEGMPPPPPLPPAESFQPLHAVLTGAALLNKATEIVHEANRMLASETARPGIAEVPLFSAIGQEGLRAMIGVLSPRWVAEGTRLIEQGNEGTEVYFVARGELCTQREGDGAKVVLARLANGAVIGETALLSPSPRPSSVVAERPSIVLRADKTALDEVADAYGEVGRELATFARDRLVGELVRTSELFLLAREAGRAALVGRCHVRVAEKGERLFSRGQVAAGIHIVASGQLGQVGVDEASGESLVEGSLGAGDVAGEVAVVLRRAMDVDVIALHPTVTLFLSAEDFRAVIEEEPRVLLALYKLAVRREEETATIQQEDATVVDDSVLV